MALDNDLGKVILTDSTITASTDANFVFYPQAGISAPTKLPNGWVEFYDSAQVSNLSYTWDNIKGQVLSGNSTVPTVKYTSSQTWIKDGIRLVWAPEISSTTDILYTIVNNQIKKWYRPVFASYVGATTLSIAYGWWTEERQNFQILPYCQVSGDYELVDVTSTVAIKSFESGYEWPSAQTQFAVWKSVRKTSYIAYDANANASTTNSNWQSVYGLLNSTKFPRWYQGLGSEPNYTSVEKLLKDTRPVIVQTYSLNSSSATITAGTTVTVTLTTTNVDNQTTVPYTITGVTSNDINGAV
jgi:hypothetical protein